jgi:uncharacterized protein
MPSHAPYPQENADDVAPTAPAGKHQAVPPCAAATAPAGVPQEMSDVLSAAAAAENDDTNNHIRDRNSNGRAANGIHVMEYVMPINPEAAAPPPVRTIVETAQTIVPADAAVEADRASDAGLGALPAAVTTGNGVTVTTTRVVTLQPCKIVYHYADHTAHTYVLQSSTANTIAGASPTPATEGHTAYSAQMGRRHTKGGHSQQSSTAAAAVRTGVAHIPASHGGDSSSLVSFDSEVSDGETQPLMPAPLTTTTTCATCGHCGCLAGVYKPPEYVADITPANPRIGSPGPVTLFAFGFTTCLYNVHQAGICPMNLTTMGLICFYGGLAQFVGVFFELVNKNTIFCTLDVTYGAFWMATAITNLVPENANVVGDAPKNYMGGFFMLWFFFAATMFASSFKFSYVQMLLNFSVTLNFFLNFLGSFIGSKTLLHVAGYEGIVEGCLATYVGMAFSMRDIYGHSILPLFFQKNFRITEW